MGKLQAGQPNLGLQEDCRGDPPDSHVWALIRQEGDGNSQDRLPRGKSCLTCLIAFCDGMCGSGYQVNVVYLGLSGG